MAEVTRSDVLLEVATSKFPVTLEEARQQLTSVSFGPTIEEEDLEPLGFVKVHPTEVPEGDVVEEVAPVQAEDGKWYRTYTVRGFTPEEIEEKQELFRGEYVKELEQAVEKQLEVGMPFQHEGATYHIQLRTKDQINLLAIAKKASLAVAARGEDSMITIRPYENVDLEMSAAAADDLTNLALVTMEEVYKKIWALKDQIYAAQTEEELPEIPSNFFA